MLIEQNECAECGDNTRECCYYENDTLCGGCICDIIDNNRSDYDIYKINDTDNSQLLGIELELCIEEMSLSTIISSIPECCFTQYDCSLNCGIEITTHPCSFAWIKENIEQFKDIFNGNLGSSAVGYGLHLHIDKDDKWTFERIRKLLYFFYNSKEELTIFSRRDAHNLRKWASLEELIDFINHSNRYKKFNQDANAIRINDKTIEVRLFNSTTNKIEFMAAIEFVNSLFNFIEYAETLDLDVIWDDYKYFISNLYLGDTYNLKLELTNKEI